MPILGTHNMYKQWLVLAYLEIPAEFPKDSFIFGKVCAETRHSSYTKTLCCILKKPPASMETNDKLREQIFEIIKNQLTNSDPPETKITFDRLRKQGFDDFQTRQMIGQCLAVELFDVMKFGKPYDNERYIKNLIALPKEPFDKIK